MPFCPEIAVGFGAPRLPAEIAGSASGADVLNGVGRVIDKEGRDLTVSYIQGAGAALTQVQNTGCRYALLKENSPSCGVNLIYDGGFSGRKHASSGVTATLLRWHGIMVFCENEIERLISAISGEEKGFGHR